MCGPFREVTSGVCGECAAAGQFAHKVHFRGMQQLRYVEQGYKSGIEFCEPVDKAGSVARQDIGCREDFARRDSQHLSDGVNRAADDSRRHIDNNRASFRISGSGRQVQESAKADYRNDCAAKVTHAFNVVRNLRELSEAIGDNDFLNLFNAKGVILFAQTKANELHGSSRTGHRVGQAGSGSGGQGAGSSFAVFEGFTCDE